MYDHDKVRDQQSEDTGEDEQFAKQVFFAVSEKYERRSGNEQRQK